MKKIFSVFVLFAMIFICGQNNFAKAQDVYAGNTGGLDFYVDTNSINLSSSSSFYVNVKKVNTSTGRLKETNQWKFYIMSFDGQSSPTSDWFFDYYLSGNMNPVSSNPIAQRILSICQSYNSRIER